MGNDQFLNFLSMIKYGLNSKHNNLSFYLFYVPLSVHRMSKRKAKVQVNVLYQNKHYKYSPINYIVQSITDQNCLYTKFNTMIIKWKAKTMISA